MAADAIAPEWPAPAAVRALVTTRACGDMKSESGRRWLRARVPAEPAWLRQVHGTGVVDAARAPAGTTADASVARERNAVCVVMAADCMPVFFAREDGKAVGVAHAGWRGLCAGVLEATLDAMAAPAGQVLAWLGPAIGPAAYEVGAEVRDAFVASDARAASAFAPTRPGHWRLDLYAVAKQRLAARGLARVYGGGYCTASEPDRFYSWRRDAAPQRMAAAIWLG
jgi:YfiH family protein